MIFKQFLYLFTSEICEHDSFAKKTIGSQIVSDETSERFTQENKCPTREERLAKNNKECKHLIEHLISKKYPEGLTKNEAWNLRNPS